MLLAGRGGSFRIFGFILPLLGRPVLDASCFAAAAVPPYGGMAASNFPCVGVSAKHRCSLARVSSRPSGDSVRELDFVVSRYSLNGTWLGFESLTSQFQLCGGLWSSLHTWRYFGLTYTNNCTISFSRLLDLAEADGGSFYDVYLNDGNDRYAGMWGWLGVLGHARRGHVLPWIVAVKLCCVRWFRADLVRGQLEFSLSSCMFPRGKLLVGCCVEQLRVVACRWRVLSPLWRASL